METGHFYFFGPPKIELFSAWIPDRRENARMFHTSTYFGGLRSRFPRSGARKNVGNSLSSCHYISGGGHSLEEVEQGEEEGENEMAETKV